MMFSNLGGVKRIVRSCPCMIAGSSPDVAVAWTADSGGRAAQQVAATVIVKWRPPLCLAAIVIFWT